MLAGIRACPDLEHTGRSTPRTDFADVPGLVGLDAGAPWDVSYKTTGAA